MSTTIQVHLWDARPNDYHGMAAVERDVFEHPYGTSDFIRIHRNAHVYTLVATIDPGGNQVVGYLTYQRKKRSIQVTRIAVSPPYQRQGVGTQLLKKVERMYSKRDRIFVDVPEEDLRCQLWLRSCGYFAVVRNVRGRVVYRFSMYLEG